MILTRVSHVLARASRVFAGLACGVLAVLITVVVFQRFVTNDTPRWAEELPRLVLIWATFIGAVACSRDRSHLMAGLLPYLVKSESARCAVDRLNQLLIVASLCVLGWAGWKLSLLTMDHMMSAIDISAGVAYLALPVGCALAALVHLAQCFEPCPSTSGATPDQE